MVSPTFCLFAFTFALISTATSAREFPIYSLSTCPANVQSGKKPSDWGHLYLEGQIEAIEHYSATSSGNFPCNAHKFEFADPPTLCDVPRHDEKMLNGSIIVAHRGDCTFGKKVLNAFRAGGVGLVLVNHENTLFSMPYDLTHDELKEVEHFPAVLVRPRAGLLLERYHNHTKLVGAVPSVKIVGEYQKSIVNDRDLELCGKCQQVTGSHVEILPDVAGIVTGGILTIYPHGETDAMEFEFLAPSFGSPLLLNKTLDMVAADPIDGCSPIANILEVQEKAVFIKRGGCPFSTKLENALNAHALVTIFGNTPNLPITNPGVHEEQLRIGSDIFSSGTLQTSVIVSHIASNTIEEKLNSASSGTFSVQLTPSAVDIEHFEPIEQMYDMEYWSPIHDERKAQLESALAETRGSLTLERSTVLQQLFERANLYYSETVSTTGLPSQEAEE